MCCEYIQKISTVVVVVSFSLKNKCPLQTLFPPAESVMATA